MDTVSDISDTIKLSEISNNNYTIPAAHQTKEAIHVLFSNCYEICVVDIKQPEGKSNIDYLTKKATLKLGEEQRPVSVGLLRFGSHVYMAGGNHLPSSYNPPAYFCSKPSDDLLETSQDTFRLSISSDGKTLSATKCYTSGLILNLPKLWPVGAELNGELHVFDSAPCSFCKGIYCEFTHEVFTCGQCDPVDLVEIEAPVLMRSHLVVGNYIFARASNSKYVLFDSKERKWTSPAGISENRNWKMEPYFDTVWDILHHEANAMCLKEINIEAESYYVVLAIMRSYGNSRERENNSEVIVAVYLVTSEGLIVGLQTLQHFFSEHVKPFFLAEGAIIKGGGTDGKMMCAVLTGYPIINGCKEESPYFFSITFTVELVGGAASRIKRNVEDYNSRKKKKYLEMYPMVIAIDGEVVRIDIKDRCVYKINEDDSWLSSFGRMEACFL